MSVESEHIAERVSTAAARTVAERTSRLFGAWSEGSPVPDEADRRCEGVADLEARRARVWQVPMGTAGLAAKLLEEHPDSDSEMRELTEPVENIYDGHNSYLRVGDNWTGFFLGEAGGPRGINDPLWPLDALYGAKDAIELGTEDLRDVATTRYQVTIDLARADAAAPAGVTVPAVPYRALSQIPAEVWLDSAGRARRISVNNTDPGDEGQPIWSIVELWDFGVAADIVPPGPDEVLPPREAYSACEMPPAKPPAE